MDSLSFCTQGPNWAVEVEVGTGYVDNVVILTEALTDKVTKMGNYS